MCLDSLSVITSLQLIWSESSLKNYSNDYQKQMTKLLNYWLTNWNVSSTAGHPCLEKECSISTEAAAGWRKPSLALPVVLTENMQVSWTRQAAGEDQRYEQIWTDLTVITIRYQNSHSEALHCMFCNCQRQDSGVNIWHMSVVLYCVFRSKQSRV